MNSIFDRIVEYNIESLKENVTQADQDALLNDLNSRLASMPPAQRGAIMDLLTNLKNSGGTLVPGVKTQQTISAIEPQEPAIADTTKTDTTAAPQTEKEKETIDSENKKSAENLARQQVVTAGNQSSGYAKG